MRTATTALVITAAALLPLALAGCTSSDNASAAGPQSSRPAVVPAATTSATTATKAPSDSAKPADPASSQPKCTFKADLNIQPPELSPEPGTGKAMLALTNKSGHTCSLRGWGKVTFYAANDSDEGIPVKNVDQPGPATDVTLKNGETAFAGVKWNLCDKTADESCKVSTTVRITPPGASAVVANIIGLDGKPVLELPVSQAQVGTLQPSNEGVVAW